MRLIHACIAQLKAQGPSRTCNESKEEEEGEDRRDSKIAFPQQREFSFGVHLGHAPRWGASTLGMAKGELPLLGKDLRDSEEALLAATCALVASGS